MKATQKLLIGFLRKYYQSGLRGSWQLTDFLAANFTSLQNVCLPTENGLIYLDLRIGSARDIVRTAFSQSGEDVVMKKFIRPGDIVFDVGAHLGFYTLLVSKLVGKDGKVFAFEPNPELLPSLRQTVGHLANVTLFECALSDKAGKIELFVPEDASMASLSDWTAGGAGSVHSVRCDVKVLGELVESGEVALPQFIKCDVEGAELAVFSGARNILDRVDAPVVLFELNTKAAESFGNKPTSYHEFFESMDAADFDYFEVQSEEVKEMRDWDVTYTNILAIPASRR